MARWPDSRNRCPPTCALSLTLNTACPSRRSFLLRNSGEATSERVFFSSSRRAGLYSVFIYLLEKAWRTYLVLERTSRTLCISSVACTSWRGNEALLNWPCLFLSMLCVVRTFKKYQLALIRPQLQKLSEFEGRAA